MKGKQLFLLLLLAAVVGSISYILSAGSRASWSESGGGGGKVIEFPINDVTNLKIKSSAGELNLVKKGEEWVVQERADYPASFQMVSGFVRKLWDLKTGQEVKVGPSQMARLELVPPGQGDKTGTLVEMGGADGRALATLLLGKNYGSSTGGELGLPETIEVPKGRYVQPLNGVRVSLVSDPLDDARPDPKPWLRKDFVKIIGPKTIAVSGPTADRTWTVTRANANAEWSLADARPEEKADNSKTFRLSRVFSAPTFLDVLAPDADPVPYGLDQPTIAKIETFDGFHYELQIGKTNGETFPTRLSVSADLPKERTPDQNEKPEEKAKLDDAFKARQKELAEKLTNEQRLAASAYLVPKIFVEELLKDRAALLAHKPSAPSTPPAPTIPLTTSPPAPPQ